MRIHARVKASLLALLVGALACGGDAQAGGGSEGWVEQSDVDLSEVCERIVRWGIPQVICTDVESDGTLAHPNYPTYEDLGDRLPSSIQLIAAGGISQPEHIARLKEIGVGGAIVGRALYEGDVAWEELIHAG